MKQLKFFAAALILLMGITFTSCLDSDNDNGYDAIGLVRVQSLYGQVILKDLTGATFVPTASSLASMKQQGVDLSSNQYDLVQVLIKWVDENQNQGKASSRMVELVGVSPFVKANSRSVVDMAQVTTPKEAPVVTLEPGMDSYGNSAKPWIYGAELVVLPIHWRMENKQETVKQHTFTLYYVNAVSESTEDVLTLYMLHDKGTDPETDSKKMADAMDSFTFDVQSTMTQYKMKHGAYPNKIIVKAKCATDGATMPKPEEGKPEDSIWKEFTIDSSSLNKTQNQ